MPTITVLPHQQLCPAGATLNADTGQTICEILLRNDIAIEHACEQSCACTTCHVIVREGFNSLDPAEEEEDDLLDKAWGLTALSRLSCQAHVQNSNLIIEIPKYTLNHAREHHDKDWDI